MKIWLEFVLKSAATATISEATEGAGSYRITRIESRMSDNLRGVSIQLSNRVESKLGPLAHPDRWVRVDSWISETEANQLSVSHELVVEMAQVLTAVHVPGSTSKANLWAAHDKWSREHWKEEVSNGDTQLGYWEWVDHKIESNA